MTELFKLNLLRLYSFLIIASILGSYLFLYSDYLWIIHDDPNLLTQALKLGQGYLPNIDFFSGYPGLAVYLQAKLIWLIENPILSQNIFQVITFFSMVLFYFGYFQNLSSLYLAIVLFIIFEQTIFLNPSPNPGFLGSLLYLIGVILFMSWIRNRNLWILITLSVFFAFSFLLKQYAIIVIPGLIFYFLFDKFSKNEKMLGLLILIFSFSISVIPFLSLVLKVEETGDIFILVNNYLIISLPIFFLSIFLMTYKNTFEPKKSPPPFFSFLKIIFLICFISFLFLGLFYGFENILKVLKIIFIEAPGLIWSSELIIESKLLKETFMQNLRFFITGGVTIFALMLPIIFSHYAWKNKEYLDKRNHYQVLFLLLFFSLILLLPFSDNLSATPILMFFIVINFYVSSVINKSREETIALFSLIYPNIIFLVPYPNYSYFLIISIGYLLFSLNRSPISTKLNLLMNRKILFLSLSALLVLNFIYESFRLRNIETFNSEFVSFKSYDERWHNSLEDAESSINSKYICNDYGCQLIYILNNGDIEKTLKNNEVFYR